MFDFIRMKAHTFARPSSRGFSLVELLVTIAVIAILAAVAIPNMLNIGAEANYAKARRNAQTVAGVAGAAKAAGATVNLSTTNAIALLQPPGVTAVLNGGASLPFSISEMSALEQAQAAIHLEDNPDTNGSVILKSP